MSQKPHLDDFFRAARRQKPVISQQEIDELIRARHTQTTTQHFTWEGIGMTSLGIGLAAVFSYFMFFASPDELPQTAGQSAETGFQRSKILPQNSVSPIERPQLSNKPVKLATIETPGTPRTPAVEAPIKIDEMKITEPREADMKRLGMKVDGGREVVVVQKVGKKFFVVTFAAKPFKVSCQLEEKNPTDIEATETLPVFVTNLDGTGILTANALNENTSILTKEVHSSNGEGNRVEKSATNVIVGSDNTPQDIATDLEVPDLDSQEAGPLDGNFELNYNIDSLVNVALAGKGTAVARAKILVKHDDPDISIDASSAGDTPENRRKEVRIAVKDGENTHTININGLDSIYKKVMIATLCADSVRSNMKDYSDGNKAYTIEMEALKMNLEKMAKDLSLRIGDSSAHVDMHKLMDELRNSMAEVRIGKRLKDGRKQTISVDPPILRVHPNTFVVPSFGELKAKVNDLVPMRVALSEERGEGLIFWYEPSAAPSVIEQGSQSVAHSSSIENLSVNPNPARDHATVRFTMKEAHAVSVTVHDILGKRLLEAGQIEAGAGGEFSRELDLSSLAEGVYLIVLTADNGQQRIERILVNK